jgi:uncharacterized membrane protein YvbJ
MYCIKCGAQVEEGSHFCGKCGQPVTSIVTPAASQPEPGPPAAVAAVRTNSFAVASLVLGIIGFFFHLLSVLAIIFSGIALSQLNKNPVTKGKGLAVAGLVLGIVSLFLWFLFFIVVGMFFWWPFW